MEDIKSRARSIKDAILRFLHNIKKKISLIKPADAIVLAGVLALSMTIVVPSFVTCAVNFSKAACERHMYLMIGALSDELEAEAANGGTYWHDLISTGNYRKLLNSLTDKVGEKNYPASDFYIRTGEDTIAIISKKHKDITEKEVRFAAMQNINIAVAEKPMIAEKVVYLTVNGPDTYYKGDVLDEEHPDKMVFRGREADKIIQNLKVNALYAGGVKREIPRSAYTITSDTLDMTKSGEARLIITYNPTSVWDNSAYAPFVIDIIGEEDAAPLIVDAGINGRYELAAWDWSDFVAEAAQEDEGKDFDASIIYYSGKYYYYPDGLHITNANTNTTPHQYALNIDDNSQPAYSIEFDLDSIILNSSDGDKVHNGSLKAENELVYIWQDEASKELPAGWIRVYCEMKQY